MAQTHKSGLGSTKYPNNNTNKDSFSRKYHQRDRKVEALQKKTSAQIKKIIYSDLAPEIKSKKKVAIQRSFKSQVEKIYNVEKAKAKPKSIGRSRSKK